MLDLRQWLDAAEGGGLAKKVDGAGWDNEIGALTALNLGRKDPQALLFDHIPGYPPGRRVLSCSTSSRRLVAMTFGIAEAVGSDLELTNVFRHKLPGWETSVNRFPPEQVSSGAILQNHQSQEHVDVLAFPAPKWHELDGGRYIGTGDAVITRDREGRAVNLGTHRIEVHDARTVGLLMTPGKHAKLHIEQYHARGERCPVAVSVGHHPLFLRVAGIRLPEGAEYKFIGAIQGEPVKVIREEVTGLPVPADSEIVLAGWCPPGKEIDEGPFGEWVGYYASKKEPAPVIEIERIYYRNDPIILGSPPGKVNTDSSYYRVVMGSALLHNELEKAGVPDIKGVWLNPAGLDLFMVISLKQRYAGHARQAALLATANRLTGSLGRYVVVVDEDVDPTNIQEVLWAICTRSDPEKDIDIIRRLWSSTLDPMIRKPTSALFNSRAIIDACKPFEWMQEFPKEISISSELEQRVREKWNL